jgi:hypothetical protein
MTTVSAIVSEFISNIDTDKEYGLAEIKAILSTAYKTVKSASASTKTVKKVQKTKSAKTDESPNDEGEVSSENDEKTKKKMTKRQRDADGNIVKKRAPSAYNLFVAAKIAEIKTENTGLNSKEIFKMAIEAWNKQKADKSSEVVASQDEDDEDNE